MELFPWNPRFATGINDIDDQHKELIMMINRLHDAMMLGKGRGIVGDILRELMDYTEYHFRTEEELFEKHRYPQSDEHRRQHNYLAAKVAEFHKDHLEGDYMITVEVSEFLKEWLSSHILGSDMDYSPFLRSRGER